MIDGHIKHRIDPIWEWLACGLARVMTANQVTLVGLFLVCLSCVALWFHQSAVLLGVSLAFSFTTDSLDGAVARLQQNTSYVGGYLDALVDRYQEVAIFITLGLFADAMFAAFLACAGSLMVSYAKARTAIEIPISNTGWPDLFERQERIIYLCVLLIIGPLVADAVAIDYLDFLAGGLWLLAALCHLTALQRAIRALRLLGLADRNRR